MKLWQRLALGGTYGAAGAWVYLSRGSLPAHSAWAAAVLIGLACWEFEPILKMLMAKARPANDEDDGS